MLPLISNILFFLSATLFTTMAARTLLCLRFCPRLPKDLPKGDLPLVSVVLAARDEAERIEGTIRRILSQQHVPLEVVAVDDRSRDATSQILKKLSLDDSRVRPKRIDSLPEDWLGKCHACHVGASSAQGEWLLFTDADCWLKPDVLARALAVAQRENAQHVTLTPGVAAQTIPAEAWHLGFIMTAADWIEGVNRDHPHRHLGVGAFNLVRTDLYRNFGGHETLRLSVVDDVKLGRLVRRAGGRTRAFIGGDDAECHWGITVRQIVKIMEKNYFAAIDYRLDASAFVGVVMPLLWVAAVIGPFTGTFLGFVSGAALLANIAPAAVIAKRLGWPLRGAFMTPFAFVAIFYALLKSTIVTLRQGGIRWRDTFYPLEQLKKGNVK